MFHIQGFGGSWAIGSPNRVRYTNRVNYSLGYSLGYTAGQQSACTASGNSGYSSWASGSGPRYDTNFQVIIDD